MIRRVVPAACIVWVCSSIALPGAAAGSVDPVTEWSLAASAAAAASGMAPLRTPVTLALLHVGLFDAVRAAAAEGPPQTSSAASTFAAVVEAGYHILLAEFPGQASSLQLTYEKLLAVEPESTTKAAGIVAGRQAAQRLLALRANDGRNAVIAYQPGSGPGAWVSTPPAFLPSTTTFLGKVKPFTMESASQFRPSGPPRLDSKKWQSEYKEVMAFGGRDSSARTPEQTAMALFWEPLAGTVWPATIRRVARERMLDLPASARFQAAAFAAFADGLIACWDAKFHFNFWRPVTAIHHGDADGNSETIRDPDWEPLTVTPNFPEYPSGHACATAAVTHTIDDFFQHDVVIPARNVVTGEERHYRRAGEIVDEVIDARVWLGVHFRSGDEDGAEIGRKIARQIRRDWLRGKS